MTDQNDLFEDTEDKLPDELETLKKRADKMGIKYHPSIGLERLKEKVNGAIGPDETMSALTSNDQVPYVTEAEYKRLTTRDRKRRAANLIRVNVTCMNPDKKEWEGEIISVGSAKLGTWKKYIPFNTVDGWHVPHIIYLAMKERKCSVFHTVKDHLGNKVRKAKLVNEFSMEILPPLTKEELKALAQRQAMANGTDAA